MTMGQLKYLVLHCSATPEGREVTGNDIRLWHTMPADNSDGTVTYKGRKYKSRQDLPNDMILGKDVRTGKGRGWSVPGYARFIRLDGTVEQLVHFNADARVDPWEITNGVAGINSSSRHFCYAGGTDAKGKPKDTRTPEQLHALKLLVMETILDVPGIVVCGHYQFDSGKACPSFDVPAWLRSIKVPERNILRK